MPGTNEPHRDGQAFNAPRAPLPPGVTTLSACTERDPSGKQIALCGDRAIFAIRADAAECFGIIDEAQLSAIETTARAAHHFVWAVATRQASAFRLHEYQGMGMGGGVVAGLPHALRRFPSALLSSFVSEEKDPRDHAALVAQNASGGHELIEAALALGGAHVAAVDVARGFVADEAVAAYHARTTRHDQPAHVRPVATHYMPPDYDRRRERLANGRQVAAATLRKWGAPHGISGDALDRLELGVACAYSVGFSLARIVPFEGHDFWLHTELRPEPLQRAATMALAVAREPKLASRPLDVEIVMGDFVHGAIVRDVPTFANVLGAALAIRAAVRAVVDPDDTKPATKRAKGGKS